MEEDMLVKKKKRNRFGNYNKYTTLMFTLGLLLVLVGFSYAFFVYNRTGLYTHTITGGKMSIIYDETSGNNITLANSYPLTDKEAETKALEFEFTITGYNESEKNIYYAIEMDYGEDIENKMRFKDSDLKLSLYENEEKIFKNEVFDNLDNQDIHYGYIKQGTSVDNSIINNYKLRIWISDYVIISDTINDDLSTWTDFEWDFLEDYNFNIYNELMNSDSQNLNDFGISIYTSEEFSNMYASFKVNVTADLTYDDVGYLTYDANGGSFTPSKTSLTTGKVTLQKPVMENKGFLGWSSTPNGEVEFKAGDIYTGKNDVLYAVYSDTRNVMGQIEDVLKKIPLSGNSSSTLAVDTYSGVREIYFINDTQENIDARYNQATYKADLTYNNQGSVKGWLEQTGDTEEVRVFDYGKQVDTKIQAKTYILYIASENTVYLNEGRCLFSSFLNTKTLDLTYIDTSLITDMSAMFGSDQALETTDIRERQLGLRALEVADFSSVNTSNVTDMNSMFLGCNLATLDLDNFDTCNVTNMNMMFALCNTLNFNVSSFDTSKVTNMYGMFGECKNVISLDLSNFNTSNVMNMSSMFILGSNILSINLSKFNTSNVVDMSVMFSGCESLTTLDLSNFDTSNVTDMSGMFAYCSNLLELDVSNFNTSNVTNMLGMFIYCENLQFIDVSYFNTINVSNMAGMFAYCSNLLELDVSNFDTSNVTDMSGMFGFCDTLEILDLSNFNTSNVTNMTRMFDGCSSLEYLDVSDWDTGEVKTMMAMFYNCSELEILDVSKWNTENVEDMSSMFGFNDNSYGKLKKLDVSNWDTGNVKKMNSMFWNCTNLESLDVSKWDTSNVENMSYMFGAYNEKNKFKSLDVSNWNTSKVTNMRTMFQNCNQLEELDLSKWNISLVKDTSYMFWGCSSLKKIYNNDDWSGNVTTSNYMFSNCTSLVGTVSFNSSKVDITMANPDTGYFTRKSS